MAGQETSRWGAIKEALGLKKKRKNERSKRPVSGSADTKPSPPSPRPVSPDVRADMDSNQVNPVFEEVETGGESEKSVESEPELEGGVTEDESLPLDLQMKVDAVTLGLKIAEMKSELKNSKRDIEGMKQMRVNPERWSDNIGRIEQASGQSLDDEIARTDSIFFENQVAMAEKELELSKMGIEISKLGLKDAPPLPVSTTEKKSKVSVWDKTKRGFTSTRWNIATFDEQRGVYGVTKGKGEEMKLEEISREDLEAWQTPEGYQAMKDIKAKEDALEEVKAILEDHTKGKLVDARQNALGLAQIEEKAIDNMAKAFFANGDSGTVPRRRKRGKKKRNA